MKILQESGSGLDVALSRQPRRVRRYPRSPEHAHPFFELCFVSEGHLSIVLEKRRVIKVGAEEMVLTAPNCFHHEEYEKGVQPRAGWIGFVMPEDSEIAVELAKRCAIPLRLPEAPDSPEVILEEVVREQREKNLGWQEKIHAGVLRLIILVLRADPTSLRPPKHETWQKFSSKITHTLTSASHFMQEHCGESVSISELARYFDLSPAYFSSVFRQHFGLSPKAYLIAARINKARKLLAENNLSNAAIAEECGFYDESHFSRVFQKQTGVLPGNYKRQGVTGETSLI